MILLYVMSVAMLGLTSASPLEQARKADPLNINGGVGTIGTINNQEGRIADPDPLNINGGVGTIGTINNNEGRIADPDPLNINGGVGTIGTINNQEGRIADPDPLNINGGVGTIGVINNQEGRDARKTPHPHTPFVYHPIHGECEVFDDHEAICRHCYSCRLVGSSVHCNCFGRFADPFNINGGVGTIGTINNQEGRIADPDPLNINGGVGTIGTINNQEGSRPPPPPPTTKPPPAKGEFNINGGVGTIGTINNQEGRLADPLNINSGVGTIGVINNQEGRYAEVYPELLPCPYYAEHPKQHLCNYAPYTWTPLPEAVARDARRDPHPHTPFVYHPIHGECEVFDDHEAICRHCYSCRLVGSSVHCNCFGRFADPFNINGGVGVIGTINNREYGK